MSATIPMPSPGNGLEATHPTHGKSLGLNRVTTTVRSARATYIDEGQGPCLLLLHGAPLTSLGFVRVIRELAKSHRVVAPDFPGFGGSELPAGFSGKLEAYADFVREFCQKLGLDDLVLYVNDSSGCIGLAAAAELAPGTVTGLVVADTVPIPLTGAARLVGFVLRYVVSSWLVRALNRKLNLLPWLVATVAPWLKPFSAHERRILTGEFDTIEKRERVLDLFEQMGRDRAFMRATTKAAKERLSRLPTLILYGQFDPMRLIGGVHRYRVMFPRSEVAIVPREEHFPILSSGEAVARIVREWMDTFVEPRARTAHLPPEHSA